MFEAQSSLLGSTAALAVLGYGLMSAFVTGPLIIERKIEKSGWYTQCTSRVENEFQSEIQSTPDVSDILCGGAFGPFGAVLCDNNNPFKKVIDAGEKLVEQELKLQQLEKLNRARIDASRCRCAVRQVEDERVSLGLYTGSARIITPSLFKDFNASLNVALNAPACSSSRNDGGQ